MISIREILEIFHFFDRSLNLLERVLKSSDKTLEFHRQLRMGTLCLSKEYKSPPPKIRTSLVESVVGSHRMKVNAPRQGRIEKKLCKLKRIGIVPVEISVICISTQFSIVWTFGFNCPVGVKIPTVIKISTFREQKSVVKCWVSINPGLKFIQIFRNRNI